MKEKTQIRQAENDVKIEGVLKELKLEIKKDDKQNNIIRGNVIIQVSEKSECSVSVYASEKTKEGKFNKAYKGLNTVMNEYVSIAALMKGGKTHEEAMNMATKVRVGNGNLSKNEFYFSDEFVSNVQFSANFFNRVDEDEISSKAEFEIECYFEKIRKEFKKGEETGRILIEGIVPLYGGKVVPMEFVAEGEIAEHIEDNFEIKKTGLIWGDIINIVEHTTVKKHGFGKDKEDVKINYKRELLITGGNEEQYEEDDKKAYTTEQIQAAWKVRETETLPELLKKQKNKNKNNKTMGITNGEKSNVPNFKF